MYFLTPSLIHHWKALVNDQSFPMTSGHKLSHGIFKKISFVDPAKRQNFGNASAEKCIPVLRVCTLVFGFLCLSPCLSIHIM